MSVITIFKTFTNFILEKNTVKHPSPNLLSTEVMQRVIGHVYLHPPFTPVIIKKKKEGNQSLTYQRNHCHHKDLEKKKTWGPPTLTMSPLS